MEDNIMKKYVKASRIGKTKEVFVVQEYTGYGNGWEDVCEYPDNSSESWKEAKQDVKDYKDNGYSARIIRRRVPNSDYVAPEVTSSKSVACASGYDLLQNIVEVTKGTWFAPMSDFSKIVYNADEIIPVIDFDACIEFGTFNGQELLIYDEVDGRRHIRYSCSMTTMFDKLVLTDVWDSTGKIYECDWDAIWNELENSHSR
jgi:hypothetical protein